MLKRNKRKNKTPNQTITKPTANNPSENLVKNGIVSRWTGQYYVKIFLWVWGFSLGGILNFFGNSPKILFFPAITSSIFVIYSYYKIVLKKKFKLRFKIFFLLVIITLCSSFFYFVKIKIKERYVQHQQTLANEQSKKDEYNSLRKAVDDMPTQFVKLFKDLQSTLDVELTKKYPLGYTFFTMSGRNHFVYFTKPNSEPIQTNWEQWSLTILDKNIKLHSPDFTIYPNTMIYGTDFILPNVIGAYAKLPVDPVTPNSGIALDRNTIHGTLPGNALNGDQIVIPEGGVFIGNSFQKGANVKVSKGALVADNDFGQGGNIQIGNNPTLEIVVEIVADGPNGRVLVLGLRPL